MINLNDSTLQYGRCRLQVKDIRHSLQYACAMSNGWQVVQQIPGKDHTIPREYHDDLDQVKPGTAHMAWESGPSIIIWRHMKKVMKCW